MDFPEFQAELDKAKPPPDMQRRVVVRLPDGRDVDISHMQIKYDGVLGSHVVIHTKTLDV